MLQHLRQQGNAILLFTQCVISRCFTGISGAGQGIGRAFAHALGEAGASVAVADINLSNAHIVTEELRSKGIKSIAVHTDVSKKADCAKYIPSHACHQHQFHCMTTQINLPAAA